MQTLGYSCAVAHGHQKAYVHTVCDIPIHDICSQLGPSLSLALPLFHAITGCDTTSHFVGCGKKTGWMSWQNTSELTDTLMALTH